MRCWLVEWGTHQEGQVARFSGTLLCKHSEAAGGHAWFRDPSIAWLYLNILGISRHASRHITIALHLQTSTYKLCMSTCEASGRYPHLPTLWPTKSILVTFSDIPRRSLVARMLSRPAVKASFVSLRLLYFPSNAASRLARRLAPPRHWDTLLSESAGAWHLGVWRERRRRRRGPKLPRCRFLTSHQKGAAIASSYERCCISLG